MGNTISQESRRCGLCYFKLKENTPFLNKPAVSRRTLPAWPVSSWEDGLLDDPVRPSEGQTMIELKTELIALQTSFQRGCVGCAAIWQCLGDQLQERGLVLDQKCLQEQCELTWLVGDRSASSPSLAIIVVTNTGGNKYRKEYIHMTIGYTGRTRTYLHPAARKVSRAVAQGYTGSPASLQNLKIWLKECASSHQACKQPASLLPYRILKLSRDSSGSITARLVQDSKEEEPYACLSHRWGASTYRCRTTRDTISMHFRSVPWRNLPKTFQEAAEVALYLDLEYLWIDSLCIIQDNKDDWKTQAAQMCSIYRGSSITIAATSSGDSDDGLFWTVSRIPMQTPDSSSRQLFIYKTPEHLLPPEEDLKDDFPLLRRGWVYQERILAPRVVHFSRYELRFECARSTAPCECGRNDPWFEKHNYNRILAGFDLAEIRNYWHQIVFEFSALQLTYHSDCLPALAGIARQYGTAHRSILGRYVAGLWEGNLLHDLLWYASKYGDKRPDVCRVPSWSWASTTAQTGMLRYNRTTDDLEVVSFDVDLAGPDEYGPVNSSELIVRGYLALGSWKCVDSEGRRMMYFYAHPKSISHYIHIDYDFSVPGSSRYMAEGTPIYCLKTGFVGDGCHVCLVLRAVDEKEWVFERIGLLHNARQEEVSTWFEDGQTRETLKLV